MNREDKSVLFVCTGNIFRSLSAELCFKKYLEDNNINEWRVGSAGIVAKPEEVDTQTLKTLSEIGLDGSTHKQRKLTKEMLDIYEVVVAMAEDHIEFMKNEFGYKYAILFNELAVQEETSIIDIVGRVEGVPYDRQAVEEQIDRTVREIAEKTPAVFKNVSERIYLLVQED